MTSRIGRRDFMKAGAVAVGAATAVDATDSVAQAVNPAAAAGKGNFRDFDTITGMLGNKTLTYRPGTPRTVIAGDILRVRSVGFAYRVQQPDATDHHLATAGGVKLNALPTAGGYYNFLCMNPDATGVDDCWHKLDTLLTKTPQHPAEGRYRTISPIYFPAGVYFFSKTIELKVTAKLFGPNSGTNAAGAQLVWPADTPGIVVNRYNTLDGGTQAKPTTAADGTLIEGLRLVSRVGRNKSAHAIWLRARAEIRDFTISGWSGNGVHIVASAKAGGAAQGNANNFLVDTGRIEYCENGIFIDGADSNAGVIRSIDCSVNRRWGFLDSSFLGNTIIGCHTADNGRQVAGNVVLGTAYALHAGVYYQAHPKASEAELVATQPGTNSNIWHPSGSGLFPREWTGTEEVGFYRSGGSYCVQGANSATLLLGCYTEGGQGVNFTDQRSLVVGGLIGTVVGPYITSNVGRPQVQSLRVIDANANGTVTSHGLGEGNGVISTFEVTGNATPTGPWRFKQNGDGWMVDNANLAARQVYFLTGATDTYPWRFKTGGQVLGTGPGARFLGRTASSTSFPTSGEYHKGDMYLAAAAEAGGKVGWVCTTSGTAGSTAVFKAFGAIDA